MCQLTMRESGELLKLLFLSDLNEYEAWPDLCVEKRPRQLDICLIAVVFCIHEL